MWQNVGCLVRAFRLCSQRASAISCWRRHFLEYMRTLMALVTRNRRMLCVGQRVAAQLLCNRTLMEWRGKQLAERNAERVAAVPSMHLWPADLLLLISCWLPPHEQLVLSRPCWAFREAVDLQLFAMQLRFSFCAASLVSQRVALTRTMSTGVLRGREGSMWRVGRGGERGRSGARGRT